MSTLRRKDPNEDYIIDLKENEDLSFSEIAERLNIEFNLKKYHYSENEVMKIYTSAKGSSLL